METRLGTSEREPAESTAGWETLPLLRQRYRFEPMGRFDPPPFPGSMFHGALGHALREVACCRLGEVCAACPLGGACAYAVIFEPRREGAGARGQGPARPPAAYVLEWSRLAPHESGCFALDVLLIGRGAEHGSAVAAAVARAAETGLGGSRVRQQIVAAGWIPPEGAPGPLPGLTQPLRKHLPPAKPGARRLKLRLMTPMAIKHNGIVAHHLDAQLLCSAAARRIRLVASAHDRKGPHVDADHGGFRIEHEKIRWYEWRRLSTRQEKHIRLGGLLGTFEIVGMNDVEARILRGAAILHIGKAATMGMGRIDVQPAAENA